MYILYVDVLHCVMFDITGNLPSLNLSTVQPASALSTSTPTALAALGKKRT